MVNLKKGTRISSYSSLALLAGATLFGCQQILGIGDPKLDPLQSTGGGGSGGGEGGTAGSTGPGMTTTTTGSGTTTTTATTTTTTGTGGMGPCALSDPSCLLFGSKCVALHDNAGLDNFALRLAQVQFFKPSAFAGGFEQSYILSAFNPNMPQCRLNGSGASSWIVQVDKTAQTITVGGAKPVANPVDGYQFVNEVINQGGQDFNVAPVSIPYSDMGNGLLKTDIIPYVVVPAYLDTAGSSVLLLPIHDLVFSEVSVSPDQNCIGSYNEFGLDPAKGCEQETTANEFNFVNGAKADGLVILEEADKVIVSLLGISRSLCVILSENPDLFGDGGNPTRCKRIGGKIVFPGDWCDAENGPASPQCADAVRVSAGVAASGIKLNP